MREIHHGSPFPTGLGFPCLEDFSPPCVERVAKCSIGRPFLLLLFSARRASGLPPPKRKTTADSFLTNGSGIPFSIQSRKDAPKVERPFDATADEGFIQRREKPLFARIGKWPRIAFFHWLFSE